MKYQTLKADTSGIFLTGAILLANIDYSDLIMYALKAGIGGAVWMIFKLGTDYISARSNKKSKQKKSNEPLG